MADVRITTQKSLRESFWRNHCGFDRIPGKSQNDYPVYVRMSFVDYVDMLRRDGDITEALASRVTL